MKHINGKWVSALYTSGKSSLEIARIAGVSKEAILYHLRTNGVQIRKSPEVDTTKACDLYKRGMSTVEIGKTFGVSHTKIRNVLRACGIAMRTQAEALQKYARINTCVVCGKSFRPREHWKSGKGLNRKTCSKGCHSTLMSRLQTHDSGSSQCYYQRIRRELKPDICEMCGETNCRLDTHHVDRDHSNNTVENLMVLCVKCHAKLHYIEDDRGLQGWKKTSGKMGVT